MAKSGTSRHSKPIRKPVTIDLDPSQVKRVKEPSANMKPGTAGTAARQVPPAEPVGDFSKPKATAKPAGEPDTAEMKTEEIFSERPKAKPSAATSASAASNRPAAGKAPASKGGGGFSHLAAGLVGGVIALAGATALQWGNVHPSPGGEAAGDRLARMEQEITQLRAAPSAAGLDDASRAQLAEAQAAARQALQHAEGSASEIAALKQAAEAQPNGDNAALGPELTNRVAMLEEKLASAQTQAAQAATTASQDSGSIAEVQSRLTALESRVAEDARQPAIAAAIAATALKSAIDRGGSFNAELDAYASVAPQSAADIEALREFAGKGVPTMADLNTRFDDVANRIVATERDTDPNAGFVDQLMASAKSLVKVRPVGEVSGQGVGPITARIEAALRTGDLDRAIAEWETLPQDAKTVSADFVAEMKARRDTDALVSRTLAAALKPASPDAATATPATPSAN
ncbi:hypothetical protein DUT91_18685 [Phyllobacterium salinisoli]|uniref:Phage tail protein n=1 Tax=Phyllobacterium salinisoli TaxID=1899321 RepID=A0A368JZ32_9HYPH|nr:mitofilin family membrane protein [Phyllobacterium salinisoli]RCS22426.1 hypothetical protein DUT91_18685 [Phyllobacterium salinisoli]